MQKTCERYRTEPLSEGRVVTPRLHISISLQSLEGLTHDDVENE